MTQPTTRPSTSAAPVRPPPIARAVRADGWLARRSAARERRAIRRHPGDVLRVVVGGIILATSGAVAATDRVGTFEADLFRLINHLPSQLEVPLIAIMQAGSLGAVAASAAVALAARRPRLARDLAVSGIAAWLLAKVAKDFVSRARPGVLLNDVILRHANDGGFGFPSGHAAVAAALATAAGPFLPRRARHATWLVVGLVCVARIYVGVHFPADVIGGAALGWMIGATLHLIVGAPTRGITVAGVTRRAHRSRLRSRDGDAPARRRPQLGAVPRRHPGGPPSVREGGRPGAPQRGSPVQGLAHTWCFDMWRTRRRS